MSLAIGGDCLADMGQLRAEPAVFGHVASDPTVSRLIDTLAGDTVVALRAINTARAAARAGAWRPTGKHAPDQERTARDPLVVDVNATLVTAHSDKQLAPTFERGFGFHPIVPGPITARTALVNRWRCCCGQVPKCVEPSLGIGLDRPVQRMLQGPLRVRHGPEAAELAETALTGLLQTSTTHRRSSGPFPQQRLGCPQAPAVLRPPPTPTRRGVHFPA